MHRPKAWFRDTAHLPKARLAGPGHQKESLLEPCTDVAASAREGARCATRLKICKQKSRGRPCW